MEMGKGRKIVFEMILSCLIILGFNIGIGTLAHPGIQISPQQNVWVTIANLTNQDSMCLSMATPGDLFRTCLIGVPTWWPDQFRGCVKNETVLLL